MSDEQVKGTTTGAVGRVERRDCDDEGIVNEIRYGMSGEISGGLDTVMGRLMRIEKKVDLLAKTCFCSDQQVLYVCEPGERLSLIQGTGCAIVVHPDRPPKIVKPDGSIEQLTCAMK